MSPIQLMSLLTKILGTGSQRQSIRTILVCSSSNFLHHDISTVIYVIYDLLGLAIDFSYVIRREHLCSFAFVYNLPAAPVASWTDNRCTINYILCYCPLTCFLYCYQSITAIIYLVHLACANPPVDSDCGTEAPQLFTEFLSAVSSMMISPPTLNVS